MGENDYTRSSLFRTILHDNNTFVTENVRRISAMSRSFGIWRKFWHSVAPFKFRVLIFRAIFLV